MRYGIGSALSSDGKHWTKQEVNIGIYQSQSGWDSKMVYFPSVIQICDRILLFFNGNDFGRTGFGYADLVSW
jgi:hypothetical protein